MSREFWIQAGCPRNTAEHDRGDEDVCEAVETVFPLEAECMVMVWSGVYIPLSYKYDLGVMLADIIEIIKHLTGNSCGRLSVAWPSNTFHATWAMSWDSSRLLIESEWGDVVGGVGELLKERRAISVDKKEFLSEWRRPLEVLCAALRECGYSEDELAGMKDLYQAVRSIDRLGVLYD